MGYLKYKVLQDATLKQLKYEGSYAEAFYVIDTIRRLNDAGRKKGLFELEIEVSQIVNGEKIPSGYDICEWPKNIKGWKRMLARGLMLIVDGAFPETVEEILCSNYTVNNFEGLEALLCAMSIHGILMIQNGENPIRMFEQLSALLPEKVEDEYLKECLKGLGTENIGSEEMTHIFGIDDNSKYDEKYKYLNLSEYCSNLFCNMDNRAIQRVLREINIRQIYTLLVCLSTDARKAICNNISSNTKYVCMTYLSNTEDLSDDEIEQELEHVNQIINELRRNSEIIVISS